MDRRVQICRAAVYGQLRHGSHGARDEFIFAIYFQHGAKSRPAVELLQKDACVQQGVGNGQVTEVEQAVFGIVDIYPEKMQGVDGGDFQDAQRGDCIRQFQFLRNIQHAIDFVRVPHCYPAHWQIHDFGYEFAQVRCQGAAAYHHNGLWRFAAVQLQYLPGNCLCQLFDVRHDRLQDFLRGKVVFHAHNVGKFALQPIGNIPLYLLCHVEVQQELLGQGVGNLVPCLGYHAVGNDGAVLGNGNV